jgi:16S rRNA (guanine966-N2)-methyltransferase
MRRWWRSSVPCSSAWRPRPCACSAAPASLDLVLIDPPFDGNLFESALQAAAKAVAASGYVYLEAPVAWTDESLAASGLTVYRHLKAGAVHAHLLRPVAHPAA